MKQYQGVEEGGLAEAPWPIVACFIPVVEVLGDYCIDQGDDDRPRDGKRVIVCLIADIEGSGKGGI